MSGNPGMNFKPCIFCGSLKIDFFTSLEGHYIGCRYCWGQSKQSASIHDLIKGWNECWNESILGSAKIQTPNRIIDLKFCPMCHNKNSMVIIENTKKAYVGCDICACQGPSYYVAGQRYDFNSQALDYAITGWNKRACESGAPLDIFISLDCQQ